MANKDRPSGFYPATAIKSGSVLVMEAGSAVYEGEFVSLASDGQVDAVATGAVILGLALDNQETVGGKVRVCIDPDQVYVGQADETEIDAQTDIGNCCDVTATAQDSTYKHARMELDSSTIGASAAQLLILGLLPAADNAFGAQAKVLVKINEHQLVDAFAGV
jgi:ribosomal protein L27